MPIYNNPIYVNVRRRHFSTRSAMKSDMSGRLQEWGYVEDDDYLGVLRSGASSSDWRWFSRSKLFAPGTETTERITAGVNDIVINEPGADINFRIESDDEANAFYMDGQYGNFGFWTASLQDWDHDNYHAVKFGTQLWAPTIYEGDTESGIAWNAYYDETNTRWEYIGADEASIIQSDNRFIILATAITGAANGAITWVDCLRTSTVETVVNEGSVDHDFRVETNGNTNMLCTDGANDRVGIGAAPGFFFDLNFPTNPLGMIDCIADPGITNVINVIQVDVNDGTTGYIPIYNTD